VIEDLIGRGAREFNFLRGAQPHKFHWTDTQRETFRLEGWARTPVGHALALLDRVAAERRRWKQRFARPAPAAPTVPEAAAEAPA
jgi:hypothetical protein